MSFKKRSGRLNRRSLIMAASLICLLTACNYGPAPVVKTPSGPSAPRTQLPMPPVTAVRGGATESASANSFTLLDNRRMRLSDYAGSVVVLDFYATWCPPCREETPHLVELHKRYNARGLQIIGLNVGGPEDRDKVPNFVREFKIPYTLAFPDPAMTDLYLSDNDSIPQAFVFDRQGRLVKRFISYDETMAAELEQVIKEQIGASGVSD